MMFFWKIEMRFFLDKISELLSKVCGDVVMNYMYRY